MTTMINDKIGDCLLQGNAYPCLFLRQHEIIIEASSILNESNKENIHDYNLDRVLAVLVHNTHGARETLLCPKLVEDVELQEMQDRSAKYLHLQG